MREVHRGIKYVFGLVDWWCATKTPPLAKKLPVVTGSCIHIDGPRIDQIFPGGTSSNEALGLLFLFLYHITKVLAPGCNCPSLEQLFDQVIVGGAAVICARSIGAL
jgi:hypothetical protein